MLISYDLFLTDIRVVLLGTSGGLNSLDGGVPVSTSYDLFLTDIRVVSLGTSGSSSSIESGCRSRGGLSGALGGSVCGLVSLAGLKLGILLAILMVCMQKNGSCSYPKAFL